MQTLRAWIVIAAAACGGGKPAAPTQRAVIAQTGSPAETESEATPERADDPDPDPDPVPLPTVQASCLPAPDPDAAYRYTLGRTGGKLVVCGATSDDTLFGCWDVTSKGALSLRPAVQIPGSSIRIADNKHCHDGMCWIAPKKDEGYGPARLVMHLDGERAAVLAGVHVTIFDTATKKATTRFSLHEQVTNDPADLWFVGDTVFVLGVDAGPAAALYTYSVEGSRLRPTYPGAYLGGVAIDEDKLSLHEDALTQLTVLDGRAAPDDDDADEKKPKDPKKLKPVARSIPKGPCKLSDRPGLEIPADYQPGTSKCWDYLIKYFLPYRNAQVVPDGKGYIGLKDTALFTLDARLAETKRMKLAVCSP